MQLNIYMVVWFIFIFIYIAFRGGVGSRESGVGWVKTLLYKGFGICLTTPSVPHQFEKRYNPSSFAHPKAWAFCFRNTSIEVPAHFGM